MFDADAWLAEQTARILSGASSVEPPRTIEDDYSPEEIELAYEMLRQQAVEERRELRARRKEQTGIRAADGTVSVELVVATGPTRTVTLDASDFDSITTTYPTNRWRWSDWAPSVLEPTGRRTPLGRLIARRAGLGSEVLYRDGPGDLRRASLITWNPEDPIAAERDAGE